MGILMSSWILALLALIYVIYKLGTRTFGHFTRLGIPFEKPTPFFGNMGPMVFRTKSCADIFQQIYNKHKGKSLMGFFQFVNPHVLICDPDIIKMVTVKDFNHFTDHKIFWKDEDDDPLFAKLLMALRGERWRHMRNILSPVFTSAKMKAMFLLVNECGEQLGEHLDKKIQGAGGLLSLEMKDLYTRYSNDVIASSAFGIHCDSLAQPHNEFYEMGKLATNFGAFQTLKFACFMLSPGLMKFFNITFLPSRVHDFFYSLVSNEIAQREKHNIIRPDLIHLLMEAKKDAAQTDAADAKKKFELTNDDITAQAFLFFFAGFETGATHLCFLSHLLATNPDIQRRVQAEIDDVLAADGGKMTYDGLSRLKYMDMCSSEALRLWPPQVVLDRVCVKTYTIPATDSSPSIKVNPGEAIAIPVFALHRDEKYFPEPDTFNPERFSEENKRDINPFAYIPFGVGPRVCIGQRFAVMETKLALCCLLSRFDLVKTEKTHPTLILTKKSFSTTVDGGFWLGIKKRAV